MGVYATSAFILLLEVIQLYVYMAVQTVLLGKKYGLADYRYHLQEYFVYMSVILPSCALLKCCFLFCECCYSSISTMLDCSLELILQLCAYSALYNTLHARYHSVVTQEVHM